MMLGAGKQGLRVHGIHSLPADEHLVRPGFRSILLYWLKVDEL
jgi:hypothetical protein